MAQSFFKMQQAFFGDIFDAQSFFDKHCEFTDHDDDFVSLKDLYAILEDKPTWKVFKRKMSMVLARKFIFQDKRLVFYPVKWIGKKRYNIFWKVAKLHLCNTCQGRDQLFRFGTYTCNCIT